MFRRFRIRLAIMLSAIARWVDPRKPVFMRIDGSGEVFLAHESTDPT